MRVIVSLCSEWLGSEMYYRSGDGGRCNCNFKKKLGRYLKGTNVPSFWEKVNGTS